MMMMARYSLNALFQELHIIPPHQCNATLKRASSHAVCGCLQIRQIFMIQSDFQGDFVREKY